MRDVWSRSTAFVLFLLVTGCGGGGGGSSSPTQPTLLPAFFDVMLENVAGQATLQSSTLFIDGARIGNFSAPTGTASARMDTTVNVRPGVHVIRVVLEEQTTQQSAYRIVGTVTFREQPIAIPEVTGTLMEGDGLTTQVTLP